MASVQSTQVLAPASVAVALEVHPRLQLAEHSVEHVEVSCRPWVVLPRLSTYIQISHASTPSLTLTQGRSNLTNTYISSPRIRRSTAHSDPYRRGVQSLRRYTRATLAPRRPPTVIISHVRQRLKSNTVLTFIDREQPAPWLNKATRYFAERGRTFNGKFLRPGNVVPQVMTATVASAACAIGFDDSSSLRPSTDDPVNRVRRPIRHLQ
jgi:hypothetical protein